MISYAIVSYKPSIARISSKILKERIDASHYLATHLELEEQISRHLDTSLLRDIFDVTKLSGFEFTKHFTSQELAIGDVPCVTSQNVQADRIDLTDCIYITKATHDSLTRSSLKANEIALSYTGIYRRAAVVPEELEPLHLGPNVCKLTPVKKCDSHFFSAFLNSEYGQRSLDREKTISAQPTVNMERIRCLNISRPDLYAQNYIGDKVRQVERLRAGARELENSIFRVFEPLSECLEFQKKAWRISSSLIEPYRINPKHYNSIALSMLKKANEQYSLVSLGDLIDDRGVTGGATPIGAKYPSEGVFFVRVQNVSKLILDLSDAVYLSKLQDNELSRSRCAEGDLILTITGYPGTAAVVFAEDLPVNINQHSVRLNTIQGWPTAFIAAAINSEFGKIQVNRFAIGGTRDALDYTCVKNLMIPEFPESMRMKVEQQVFELYLSKRNSERLTIASKLFIEALIEGKITESDLIAAQKALETGERTVDREILSRITRKGMDATGELPLFPDLDGLYNTLDALDKPEDAS